MASRWEEDLSCPICRELFRDPVVLTCSHSFCQVCLEKWWKDKPMKTCPACRKRSSKDPLLNLALRNLVETYAAEREQAAPEQREKSSPQQPECSVHSEKLRLFCLDHQDVVCLVCRDSRSHREHSFIPIEEAAQDLRDHLRRSIKPLQDKLKVLDESRAQFDSAAAHVSAQARHIQTQIRAQFEKMHQFLRDEEDSRMKTLQEEEEQKIQRMKVKMATVSRDIEAVSQTISETEEQLRGADVSFLLQYKTAEEKVRCCPLVEEPEMEQGALMDQAKHLGNLGFNVWRNMKTLVEFYPVVLNPNTADPELVLSEDLTSVRAGETQTVPKNPERNKYYSVDGSEAFSSGTHSWDVEVRESKHWVVGVGGYVQRGGATEGGNWCISFINGEYLAISRPGPHKHLCLKNLQRVRVKLDLSRKTVTFTDTDTNAELLRVKDTFTAGMVPYLCTGNDIPLKILPKNITVTP